MRSLAGFLLSLLSPLACAFPAVVVSVYDGDTLTAQLPTGQQIKVRLYGLDAPERNQPGGAQAQARLAAILLNASVDVDSHGRDRYRREIAEVRFWHLDRIRSANHLMVLEGWAWWYHKYAPADATLAAYEIEARAFARGLWGLGNAVPPWEWRSPGRFPTPAPRRGRFPRRTWGSPRPLAPPIFSFADLELTSNVKRI